MAVSSLPAAGGALPWYSRRLALNQNIISGLVLFFTVGIYLAVLGLGAGGGKPSSQRMSDISNSCLYGIFSLFGFGTGAIMNKIGPRSTMTIGVFGYPFYVAGLFYYDRTGRDWFPILGGVLLGLTAPMLWSAQGFIQWAYATEAEKGRFIALQYFVNQVGSVIGSLVAFIIIYRGTSTAEGSPTAVYIVFIILMCVAFVFTVFGLVPPSAVRRADGTALAKHYFRDAPPSADAPPSTDATPSADATRPPPVAAMSLAQEMRGVARALHDYRVLAMLPVIFSCELALGILPSINGAYFSLRTRAMNNVVFYLVQLPAAVGCAWLTDHRLPCLSRAPSRRVRGLVAVSVLGVVVYAGWIALLCWITTSPTWASPPPDGVDWTAGGHDFGGPFVLYMLFGVIYGSHQLIGMWVMGTFTNEPSTLAIYGGVWKGVAAAGVAVQFGMGAGSVSYKAQVAFALALQLLSIPILLVLASRATDTNYMAEEDVIVPHYAEKIDGVVGIVPTKADLEEQGKNPLAENGGLTGRVN